MDGLEIYSPRQDSVGMLYILTLGGKVFPLKGISQSLSTWFVNLKSFDLVPKEQWGTLLAAIPPQDNFSVSMID